jgi:hypothetical protein
MPGSIREKISELRKARAAERALAKEIAALNAEISAMMSDVGNLRDEFTELSGAADQPNVRIVETTGQLPPARDYRLQSVPILPTIMCGHCRAPVEHAAFVAGSDDLVEVKCHGAADRVSVKDRPHPWAFTDVKAG